MKIPVSESPQCPYSSLGDNGPTLDLPIEKRWEARELYPLLSVHDESPADLETEARLAWRHSIRCIGRSRWQSLSVIDARSVASADELFDALRTHIERATASCAAKSIMTIFSKFDPAEPETRIWNRQ
ncbi:MAG: nitric oxide synthase oxygenase, partial [Verrucomicrobiales bacterium]